MRLSEIQIEEINEFSEMVHDMFVEQAKRDIDAYIEVQRNREGGATFMGLSDFITTGKDDLYTGGDLRTSCHVPERIAKWDTSQWEEIHELTADTRVDALLVDEKGVVYVGGGEPITAPDPNNYGREIVLGERPITYNGSVQFVSLGKKPCPYCGNTSGMTDSRGMCVSCGGDLGAANTKGQPYPSPFADWKI